MKGAEGRIDRKGEERSEEVVEKVLLRVRFGIGAVQFEHALLRPQHESAGVFDQFVNGPQAQNDDRRSDPKLPSDQAETTSQRPRDDEAASHAKKEMHIGVKLQPVVLLPVGAEGSEGMREQCRCKNGEVTRMNMQAVSEEIYCSQHGTKKEDRVTIGRGTMSNYSK
jgi:hypothetical protein